MTSARSPLPGPKRSQPGHQDSHAGAPRRALTPPETPDPPIMSGYTYAPGAERPPKPLDPTVMAPLVAPQVHPDSIDNYKTKTNVGWWIVIGVVLVVAIVGGIMLGTMPPPTSGPTGNPTAPAASPTPTRSGGLAFGDSMVSGYWQITNTQWTDSGVRLSVVITVDTGTLYFAFYAFPQDSMTPIDPVELSPTDLTNGFVAAGESLEGTLNFQVSRQPLQLVLTSRNQTQLSALLVPG